MSTPNFKIKLSILRKQLMGEYGKVAAHCGVSIPTISRQLNGTYIDSDLITKIIEYRDLRDAQILQQQAELSKRIEKKVA